ncbi:MAG: GNAT family N-acetyltransferase [Nocardioides sp.]|uniref:GNAT family N-acetyltransferase n=1 Tax=Nocardioides sp. TaxID=35761 RepID=UPI003F111BA9
MIRRATGQDVAGLVALEAEVFGVDAWSETSVRSEVDSPGRVFLVDVDEVDGALRGYAVAIVSGDIADLARIAVVPSVRRTGAASALLAALLAGTGEADRMLLEVAADNSAALAFYERHGFARIDVRARYYADGSDAVVMLRPLADAAGGGEDGNHG